MKVISTFIYLYYLLLRLYYHSSMKRCFIEDYCINLYCSILCRKYGISLQADSYFYRQYKMYFPPQAPAVRRCILSQGGSVVVFFFSKHENQLANRKLLLQVDHNFQFMSMVLPAEIKQNTAQWHTRRWCSTAGEVPGGSHGAGDWGRCGATWALSSMKLHAAPDCEECAWHPSSRPSPP